MLEVWRWPEMQTQKKYRCKFAKTAGLRITGIICLVGHIDGDKVLNLVQTGFRENIDQNAQQVKLKGLLQLKKWSLG